MANYPGTFELRFNIVTDENTAINTHQSRLSLNLSVEADPGDPFDAWFALSRAGGNPNLAFLTEETLGFITALYSTAVDFPSVELWEYAPSSFDAVFRSVYTPTANAGTVVGSTIPMNQTILVWRSMTGGIAKLDLRGTALAIAVKHAYPTGNTAVNDLLEYIADADTPYVARDDGYIFAPLSEMTGQNEHAFKAVFR